MHASKPLEAVRYRPAFEICIGRVVGIWPKTLADFRPDFSMTFEGDLA